MQSDPFDIVALVRKNSLYVLAGKLLNPVVTLVVTGFLVRQLSMQEYGIYNTLIAVMGYVSLLSSLGLLNIYQRYIPEFNYQKDYASVRTLVWKGGGVRTLLAAACIVLILVFSEQAGKLFKIEGYLNYFRLFAIGILFALECELLGLTLTSLFLHKYFVIAQIGYTWFRAGILYLALRHGANLERLLWCEIICYGVLAGLQFLFYYRQFDRLHRKKSKNPFPWKRIRRYGSFSYFNEMGEQILDVSTDFLVISSFLGPVQVAIYAFANQVMRLLSRWMPHMLIIDVITPTFFTRYAHKRSLSELSNMFQLFVKIIAFFFFPLCAGLFMLGDKFIIYFFDAKYLPSLQVLYAVAFFSMFNAFASPLGLLVQSVEKVEIHFYSKVFSIYNLVGDILVVKPFGILGVALVTGSAILFKNALTYLYIRKSVKVSLPLKGMLTMTVNSIIMGLFLFAVRGFIHNVVTFIGVAALSGLVYLAISSIHRSFQPFEREWFNRLMGKRWFVF